MKKIRHSKLPLTLYSEDHLTQHMLEAIKIQMSEYSWDDWIDEDGNWFKYWNKPNPKQMELFDETKTSSGSLYGIKQVKRGFLLSNTQFLIHDLHHQLL